MDFLRQKLSSLASLFKSRTSNGNVTPIRPSSELRDPTFSYNIDSNPLPRLQTAQSTPAIAPEGVKNPLNILNPLQPTTVRAPFARSDQQTTFPIGGPVVGGALNLASRTLEAIPSVALTTLANYRSINTKEPTAGVSVPFDLSRIGLDDHPGKTFVQNSFDKMDQKFQKLQTQYPDRTKTNIALSALSPVTDALDAFVAGDILTSVAKQGLKATEFAPELDQALQQYGLKNVKTENFTGEFVKRFNQKARQLVLDGDTEGLQQLGQATNTILTHMTGSGIPTLNRFGQLIQDVSRLGLQDAKQGFSIKNPLFSELAPQVPVEGLPGTQEVPGQGAPVGLSIRRVRRVGGLEPEAPGPYFRSKSGAFEPVEEKNTLPVNIRPGVDTIVVKDGGKYSVLEGQTGKQIGPTANTSAAAIEGAKTTLQDLSEDQLAKFINTSPLSPRYETDATAKPGEQIPYPQVTPKPNMTPDTPENAAAEYYDAKIRPEVAQNKAFVIGADDLKDYFGGDYNDKNHPIYSKAAFQLYEKALKETTGDTVLLTGGGPGAGKTEFLVKQLAPHLDGGVLYDSNMSNKDGVTKQIQMARAAGKKVVVAGIIPDLNSTRIHTILRENAVGRGISDKTFARGHAGFPRVLKELLEEGILKPNEVQLYDTRKIFRAQDAVKLVKQRGFEKDPLATLNKVQYNEEELSKKYGRENYKRKVERGDVESSSRQGSDQTSSQNRTNQGSSERRGNRTDVQRNAGESTKRSVAKGTKDINQLIRMLDREKQSLAAALANPEMHAKAYGENLIDQYKRNIKSLTKRIEEDAKPLNEKTPKNASPLEIRVDEFKTEKAILEEVIANNPAKELAKYANRNGELPEVIGGTGSKFGKSGDDIVKELGFKDSEEAREAYQEYRLQKARLSVASKNLRVLTETLREINSEAKDLESLKKFLDKKSAESEKDIAAIAKGEKDPETKEMLDKRKRDASDRQARLIQKIGATLPEEQRNTLESIGEVIAQSSPLTLRDFEKMNESFPSLNKIVIDTNTPVKDKVNLLDYLRTPDRVLKKLGLEKTAEQVRHAYESYLNELPAHIELVSEWAKRAPSKDANKRIFQYLDGEQNRAHFSGKVHTKLTGEELKIAGEIRAYLAEWADRLGLPEDNKITHYITHIFNIGEVEKEFDEDVAKLIKDKVPGSVYDPFLEKRLGKKGYIEDTWASLDAYVKRAVRKANMDPVLEKLKDAASRMEDSQATYIKKYADLINMRPTETDNLLDNFIKSVAGYRFGQRPTALLTRKARQLVYRSMLGLNVGSALKNLTQGVNTFALLGPRATLKGYANLILRARSGELEESGILKQDFVQDRTLSSTRKILQKADKGLFMLFDLAERINRGSAYFGAKDKAMRAGASETQAIQYAKKIVRDTQFQFGSIDTPVALNSDIAKFFTQFMGYGFKQAEFAAEQIAKKNWGGILRYIIGSILLTYGAGKVFNVKGRDFIPGYSFTKFGTPPALDLPLEIFKAVTDAPDYYGHPRTYSKKALDVFSAIPFPAGLQIQKTYKALTSDKKPTSSGGGSNKKTSVTSALNRLNRLKSPVKSNPALNSLNRLKKLNSLNSINRP